MLVKQSQKFVSKESGNIIKVTKVARSRVSSIYDVCTVSDANFVSGSVIPGTRRFVFADSIRRRYNKL